MSTFDFDCDGDEAAITSSNVIWLRQREQAKRNQMYEYARLELERVPVDIRGGHITFGRLMSGLATVGLAVRVDARSGRVVITEDGDE